MPAAFPAATKLFVTFRDQVDIDYAANTNEIHDEIVAIENTLGFEPTWTQVNGLGVVFPDVATFLRTLYAGTKPLPHTHAHDPTSADGLYLTDLASDTHLQYLRTDGTRQLTGQQSSVAQDPFQPLHLANKGYVDKEDAANLLTAEQFATNAANAALQQADAYTDNAVFNRLIYEVEQEGTIFEVGGEYSINGTLHEEFRTHLSNFYLSGAAGPQWNSSMGPLQCHSGVIETVIDQFSGAQIPCEDFQFYLQSANVNLAWISPTDPRLAFYPGTPVLDITRNIIQVWDVDPRLTGMGNINVIFRGIDGSFPTGQLARFTYTVIGV